jgi:hypothetical protein
MPGSATHCPGGRLCAQRQDTAASTASTARAATAATTGTGAEPFNRVTARYNRDYVWDRRPSDHPVNYAPYGGDRIGRIGDPREYHAPYQTTGGTRTWRGEWPMGWERERARYGGDFPRPRSDLGRWFQD